VKSSTGSLALMMFLFDQLETVPCQSQYKDIPLTSFCSN